MPDLNNEALEIWGALKPMIDQEIASKTQGMVQRRKAKVTTAPSLVTNTIGVTEAFGTEMFLPFVSNMISAKVGDFVWIEWMYGATNAFVSSFAAVGEKDITVAGDLTVGADATFNGVVDVVQRRCYAKLSSQGWYRVMKLTGSNTGEAEGAGGFVVDFNIVRNVDTANNEAHKISLMATWGNIKFINEQSVSNTLGITKIRTTNSGSNLYVDVYYYLSTQNTVTVAFDVTCRGGDESKFNSQPFTSVDPSQAGETELALYTFAANSESRSFYAGIFSGSSDEEVISQACEAVRTKYPSDFGKDNNTPFPISFFRQGAWEFTGTCWIRYSEVYLSVGSFGAGRYTLAYQASSGATPTVKTVTLT